MAESPIHNDKELQARLAAGDLEAFNLLVDLYHKQIYEVALGYIKIVQAAEDVTQDIFYKLWKNRDKLPEIESLKDYIFILTRNAVLDAMRKKGPRYPVGEYLESTLPDPVHTPAENLQFRELYTRLHQAIELLPPQQKKVYLLSREQGLTHEQIAEQMNLSKNTVKNHLVAALSFIRNFIAASGDWPLLFLVIGSGLFS